ncbi:MAG: PhzF family phenazine biosynthesis protein, partial [Alphaproteobacteria bacterium]|nr:PhzF family phenazine biosynthesis protein [Alphaproteobacteria bacterium]
LYRYANLLDLMGSDPKRILDFVTADVFTTRRFGGNPLAVFPRAPASLNDADMQAIAREMNLSETVFVFPAKSGDARARRVRIFTPAAELPFAGHPTVGAAAMLVALGEIAADSDGRAELVLEEGVGPVPVAVEHRSDRLWARLTCPKPPAELGVAVPPRGVVAAFLGLDEADLDDGAAIEAWSSGPAFTMVPLASPAAVARALLDRALWKRAQGGNLYLFAETAHDRLHARMFAPVLGIDEDPATGSAAVALAGLLAKRLTDGPHRIDIAQGVEMGRPSHMELEFEVRGATAISVSLGGAVVPVSEGRLTL